MTISPLDHDRPPEPLRAGRRKRRGRRADPHAMVPEARFVDYYGRNIVQAPPWNSLIPSYLFLGGVAGSSGLLAAGAHLTGREHLRRNSRVAGVVAAAAGAGALVADLGRPERFLNMMRVAKLTSPMSVGTWILAGYSAFAGLGVALEVVRKVETPGSAPAWARYVLDPLASAGHAFFSPPLAAYTAVLLSDTAVPLWNQSRRELPFIFVASAMNAGTGLAMIATPTRETRPVRQLATIAAASELVADRLLERRLGEEGRPLKEGQAHTLHRAARALTFAGGVGAIFSGRSRLAAAASGAALAAGSACTRFAIFRAGMSSAQDPIYTVRPQRRRLDARLAAGHAVTDPGGAWPQ